MAKTPGTTRATTEHKCLKCGYNKAWLPRGEIMPTYRYKCCKCGYIQK